MYFVEFNVCSFIGNVRLCVGFLHGIVFAFYYYFFAIGMGRGVRAICERKCYLQYIYIGIMVRKSNGLSHIQIFYVHTLWTVYMNNMRGIGNETDRNRRAERPSSRNNSSYRNEPKMRNGKNKLKWWKWYRSIYIYMYTHQGIKVCYMFWHKTEYIWQWGY